MQLKQEVWIFYSSESEPELPAVYDQGIQYLQESDIKTHIIDVHKRPELAEKYKIIATPVIIIKKGKEFHKFVGVVDGLRKLLTADFYGKSILHLMGFKEGRVLASRLRLPKEKKKIETSLKSQLREKGISNFKLLEFDLKKNYVKISLTSDLAKEHGKSRTPVCYEIASLLGGIFTEIFGNGMHFEELKCISQGNDFCVFGTMPEKIGNGEKRKNFSEELEKEAKK
jgi:predicted hydrocarbon binding protein